MHKGRWHLEMSLASYQGHYVSQAYRRDVNTLLAPYHATGTHQHLTGTHQRLADSVPTPLAPQEYRHMNATGTVATSLAPYRRRCINVTDTV